MRIFILNFFIGIFSSEFLSRSFFSSDDTEFIRRFPAETITHGFSRMRPVRSLQIPPESGKCPTDFTDLHRYFLGRLFVTQISQMTQIFYRGFYSSDDTEFIRRIPAVAITHGFSQMRPVRSLQIPPEVGKSPTDFTDLHRFFLGRFFCHADFADDADFSHGILFIGRHGIYSEISCCGDYSRNFADATCPVVADTP